MSVIYILLPVASCWPRPASRRSSGPSAAGSSTTSTRRRCGCCMTMRRRLGRAGRFSAAIAIAADSWYPGTHNFAWGDDSRLLLFLTGVKHGPANHSYFSCLLLMGLADAMGPNSTRSRKPTGGESDGFQFDPATFAVFIALPSSAFRRSVGSPDRQERTCCSWDWVECGRTAHSVIHPTDFRILLICIFVLGIGTTFLQWPATHHARRERRRKLQ